MDKWYNFYWNFVDDNQLGIVGKAANRLVRKYVKRHLDNTLPKYFKHNSVDSGINTTEHRNRKLVCSLTSFPARIDEIWVCIETIFRQAVKADEIVLWLASQQFPEHQIPESLQQCVEKGLTIRWVDEDLRSHKKYYYALQEYKDADIVLLDDDLYYPDQLLENLVSMARRHPGSICATRVHKMTYVNGGLNPYGKWVHNYNPRKVQASNDFFFTSGAGTLIPSGIMPQDTFNKEVFKDICFLADDVWLNMQARKTGIEIFTNDKYDKDEISIGHSQGVKLVNNNVADGGNDKQIINVLKYLNMKITPPPFVVIIIDSQYVASLYDEYDVKLWRLAA